MMKNGRSKIIIVYKSQYGSSRQYAMWLAESLQSESKELSQVRLDELYTFDVIIYVGGLYAGGVNGFKKIKKYLSSLENNELILCMVGLTNPAEKEVYHKAFRQNVPEEYRQNIEYFALRGDQLFSKMNLLHRTMMKVPKKMAEKVPQEERTEENIAFIENYGQDVRFCAQENIDCIVEYVSSLSQ